MGLSRRFHFAKWLGAVCLLAGCDGPPTAPEPRAPAEPASPDRPESLHGTPSQAALDSLRAWFATHHDIEVPRAWPAEEPAPAGKAAQTGRILGDGDRNGHVGFWDLWWFWNHLTSGYSHSGLDLVALDIDQDGTAGWIDLGFLGDYLYGSQANPHGIGQPMVRPIIAVLDPPPELPAGGSWKRFIVRVLHEDGTPTDRKVRLIANPPGFPAIVETARRSTPPTRSYCPAEAGESQRNLGDGDVVYLAGCEEGVGQVRLVEGDEVLLMFDITVEEDSSFDIELVFVEGHRFSAEHVELMQAAARRWEAIITEDLPDTEFTSAIDMEDDFDWWAARWKDTRGRVVVQPGTVDDLRIYVSTRPPQGTLTLGWGGAFLFRTLPSGLPDMGTVVIAESFLNASNVDPEWHAEAIRSVMVHEIAHVLGFGSSWMWEGWLVEGADSHFQGPEARVFFDLAGGESYSGNKVPVQIDGGHWREAVFGDEMMSPTAGLYEDLSSVTLGAMHDMGYRVDFTQADPYALPREALGKPAGLPEIRCEVLHAPVISVRD